MGLSPSHPVHSGRARILIQVFREHLVKDNTEVGYVDNNHWGIFKDTDS